jgi:chromosome segregation ATPase
VNPAVEARIAAIRKSEADARAKLEAELKEVRQSLQAAVAGNLERDAAIATLNVEIERLRKNIDAQREQGEKALADERERSALALRDERDSSDRALRAERDRSERILAERDEDHRIALSKLRDESERNMQALRAQAQSDLNAAMNRMRRDYEERERRWRHEQSVLRTREAAILVRRFAASTESVADPTQYESEMRKVQNDVDELLAKTEDSQARSQMREALRGFTDALRVWRSAGSQTYVALGGTRSDVGQTLRRYSLKIAELPDRTTPSEDQVKEWTAAITRTARSKANSVRVDS